MSLKTKVDLKYFHSKAIVDRVLSDDEHYIYLVIKDDIPYIIKGRRILAEKWNTIGESTENFVSTIKKIGMLFQEFFLSKYQSSVCPNFAKPLEIDYSLVPASSRCSLSYWYTEIIYEYGGEPLNKIGQVGMEVVYNWMKQSANALMQLHKTGIAHLKIRPDKFIYDKKSDTLKVINIGTEFDHNGTIYEPTIDIEWINKSITEFSPPELLGKEPRGKYILGAIDVYSWAMCFYALLLQKSISILKDEVKAFKVGTEENYEEFMSHVKSGLKDIEVDEKFEVVKDIVELVLVQALSYDPKARPKMSEIVKKLNEFDTCTILSASEGTLIMVILVLSKKANTEDKVKEIVEKRLKEKKNVAPEEEAVGGLESNIAVMLALNELIQIKIKKGKEETLEIGNLFFNHLKNKRTPRRLKNTKKS